MRGLRIIVVAALGCLTTVGVAWALTLDVHWSRRPMRFAWSGGTLRDSAVRLAREDSWCSFALAAVTRWGEFESQPPPPQDQMVDALEISARWARRELLDAKNEDDSAPYLTRAVVVTGWPFGSMWASFD